MKIENLREFVVFSEYLNFTTASKKLFVTQPALSYRIASMEKELGVTLVERGDAGSSITPAGKEFLEGAQRILKEYDDTLIKTKIAGKQVKRLVFERPAGMPNASRSFEEQVSAFASLHPDIEVKLVTSDGHLLKDVLLENTVDAGVVFSKKGAGDSLSFGKEFSTVSLPGKHDTALYIWLHQSHPLVSKEHIGAEDLDGYRFAIQSDARFRIGRECIEGILHLYGSTPVFQSKSSTDGIDFLWGVNEDELIISDAGLPTIYGYSFEDSQNRIFRKIENNDLSVEAHLIYLKDTSNKALLAFIDFLESQR